MISSAGFKMVKDAFFALYHTGLRKRRKDNYHPDEASSLLYPEKDPIESSQPV